MSTCIIVDSEVPTTASASAAASVAHDAARAAHAAAQAAVPHARETRDIRSSLFQVSEPLSKDDYRAAMRNKKERTKIIDVTIRPSITTTLTIPFYNFTKRAKARGKLENLRSATWTVLFDTDDEKFKYMAVSRHWELHAKLDVQHCLLVRISARFVLGFYYLNQPVRQSTIMSDLGTDTAPIYACAVVGNEEGAIYPNTYITPVQQAKHDKKLHKYRYNNDGTLKFVTTSEPPAALNCWNEKQGAAFYHHMLVHALVTVLADAQDKRICSPRDPLIKNFPRITVQEKSFAPGFIDRDSETGNHVQNWIPKRMPIVTSAMQGEQFHHVHVAFQSGTPINLSKVRAIARQDNAGNKKQRVQ